jgi:hypothetical protein
LGVADNVDRRLLPRFEASVEHERARRELLPATWLNAEPAAADRIGELFEDVLERARERVRAQRGSLEHARGNGFDPAV